VTKLHAISPELYRKYRDEVLKLSNSIQGEKKRGLTVEEIAMKLGLEVREVREILSIAEKDIPFEEWEKADRFKERKSA